MYSTVKGSIASYFKGAGSRQVVCTCVQCQGLISCLMHVRWHAKKDLATVGGIMLPNSKLHLPLWLAQVQYV